MHVYLTAWKWKHLLKNALLDNFTVVHALEHQSTPKVNKDGYNVIRSYNLMWPYWYMWSVTGWNTIMCHITAYRSIYNTMYTYAAYINMYIWTQICTVLYTYMHICIWYSQPSRPGCCMIELPHMSTWQSLLLNRDLCSKNCPMGESCLERNVLGHCTTTLPRFWSEWVFCWF